jgi:hypothetical protein
LYPHRIRLRGPWEVEPLARREDGSPGRLPPPRRLRMPCAWRQGDLKEFAGRVRFRRRFGYPGRIDPSEGVWLTLSGFSPRIALRLNGVPLAIPEAGPEPFAFPVTALLQLRNELIVELDSTDETWGEVALEVRASAYLRGVRAWCETSSPRASLQVAGEVVGTADRPLDLYVLVDGATQDYRTVVPTPEGTPFQVTLEEVEAPADPHGIRVDLINGAVPWYTIDCQVA